MSVHGKPIQNSTPFHKERDIVLFFIPEAGVSTHFHSQCVIGKSLLSRGFNVMFTLCPALLPRCPVLDMHSAPFEPEGAERDRACRGCVQAVQEGLTAYGLPALNLAEFVTEETPAMIQRELENAPDNLNDFVYDGIQFGRVATRDLGLLTKHLNYDAIDDSIRKAWLTYIGAGLMSYCAVDAVCAALPIGRLVHYNHYSHNAGAYFAATKRGIPAIIASLASHRGVDRRRFVLMSEPGPALQDRSIKRWREQRDLALPPALIDEITTDIFVRLGSRTVFTYSPAKTAEQDDLVEKLSLARDKKLLVAFTSSPDERHCSNATLQSMGYERTYPSQAFQDHVDWLSQLIAFTESRTDVQLVVRVHPREGANKRDSVVSQHLHRLKAAFSGEYQFCRIVWPEEQISSYDLAEIADLALTSWSTIGLEMARLGVPVVTAFLDYSFPDDDFHRWGGSTPDEYFATLERMLGSGVKLETIARAFRCYNQFQLAKSLLLDDIIPTIDFEGLPEFTQPNETNALIRSIIDGETVNDITNLRLREYQHPGALEDELGALRQQLSRVVHFLFTGEEPADVVRLVYLDERGDSHGAQNCEGDDARWTGRIRIGRGNIVTYDTGEQRYQRYSPMLARLVPLSAARIGDGALQQGKRAHFRIVCHDVVELLDTIADELETGDYLRAIDLVEQGLDQFPDEAEKLLTYLSLIYKKIPQDSYSTYLSRHFTFPIEPGQRVLQLSRDPGALPFATVAACIDTSYLKDERLYLRLIGREGEEKPFSIEELPYADKEFDFVYCAHILDKVRNPSLACGEIMRVAKRGFVEAAGYSELFDRSDFRGSRWRVSQEGDTLVFTPREHELNENLGCDLLQLMVHHPKTEREEALSALLRLKAHVLNTMLLWEGAFSFRV